MRPAFKPTSADLDAMCVDTCADSLAAYVAGVREACGGEGDRANESPGGAAWWNYMLDPVETVGEIFQDAFRDGCSKSAYVLLNVFYSFSG